MDSSDILQHPHVAVVILSWNGRVYLEKFLPSVVATTYPSYDIIVADNRSTDDSVAWLKQYYPNVRIIDTGGNLGFAKGYNAALKQVTAEYFILLNQDVEVAPNWLEPLVNAMEQDSDMAACMPKLRAFHHRSHFEHAGAAGGYLDALGYPFCRGRIFDQVEEDNGQYDQSQEVFWASGAALCIRPELFRRFQGFDEDYFAHMEEIDLCWRLKRAGYKIGVVPASVVYHVGGGSLKKEDPRKIYLNFRNSLSMLYKNLDFVELVWKLPLRMLVLDVVAFMKSVIEGKWKEALAIVKADWHFFWSWPKQVLKRNRCRKTVVHHAIGISRVKATGYFHGSIIWQHFVKHKDRFSELE
jgi:GT2 family glycosyltransferase